MKAKIHQLVHKSIEKRCTLGTRRPFGPILPSIHFSSPNHDLAHPAYFSFNPTPRAWDWDLKLVLFWPFYGQKGLIKPFRKGLIRPKWAKMGRVRVPGDVGLDKESPDEPDPGLAREKWMLGRMGPKGRLVPSVHLFSVKFLDMFSCLLITTPLAILL